MIKNLKYLGSRATKIILRGTNIHQDSITDLKLPPVVNMRTFNALILVFKSINLICDHLASYFTPSVHNKNTRNQGVNLRLPEVKLESARKGFYFQGAVLYNQLLAEDKVC